MTCNCNGTTLSNRSYNAFVKDLIAACPAACCSPKSCRSSFGLFVLTEKKFSDVCAAPRQNVDLQNVNLQNVDLHTNVYLQNVDIQNVLTDILPKCQNVSSKNVDPPNFHHQNVDRQNVDMTKCRLSCTVHWVYSYIFYNMY
jgi:uncharacterized protein YjbI with pentapeptide repeats